MDIINLNVGGFEYTTLKSTFQKHPNTYLGRFFDKDNALNTKPNHDNVYFFDNDGEYFKYVLNWYRTNQFFVPKSINIKRLMHELEFWNVPFDNSLYLDVFDLSDEDKQLVEKYIDGLVKQINANIVTLLNIIN